MALVSMTCAVSAVAVRCADRYPPFFPNQAAALFITGVMFVELLPEAAIVLGVPIASAGVCQAALVAYFLHDLLHHGPPTPSLSSTAEDLTCQPCEEDGRAAVDFAKCGCHRTHAPPLKHDGGKPFSRVLIMGLVPFLLHVVMDGLVLGVVQKSENVVHVGVGVASCVVQDTFALSRWLGVVVKLARPRLVAWACVTLSFGGTTLAVSAASTRLEADWILGTLCVAAAGMLLPIAHELYQAPCTSRQRIFTVVIGSMVFWYFGVVSS